MNPVERIGRWRKNAPLAFSTILFIFATLPPAAATQDWLGMGRSPMEFSPRMWQTDEGLPNNRVQAIAQTPDGYLWVGTVEGLARFDGLEFKVYTPSNTPQLHNASITALTTAGDGSLWIGTKSGGMARLQDGRFSLLTAQDGLASDAIRALAHSKDGAIWIGTTSGVSCFRDGKFQSFGARGGLSSETVTALCDDGAGSVWIGTSQGLYRAQHGAIEPFEAADELPDQSIRSLWIDRQGRLWIGTDHGILLYGSGKSVVYSMRDGLSEQGVSAIHEDRQSRLWVGTFSGLNRFVENRFQTMLNNNGTPYDLVNVLFEDSRGDLWIGSREGLIRLTSKPFSVITKHQWLSHNYVTSGLEDRRGRLWVGTRGGIEVVTPERVEVYSRTNQFSTDVIKAVCERRDGSIWAGADYNGGLFCITDQGVTHYGARDGLTDQTISVLHEDSESNLWIGTRVGVCRLSHGAFVRETNTQDRPIWAICEDAQRQVWFGGDAGLFRRRDGTIENLGGNGTVPAEPVSALYADEEGNVWIGTRSDGLIWWHANHWDRFTVQDGLYSNEILGIAENHGWLWMTSTKGIFRLRKDDLETLRSGSSKTIPCITYGKADGLMSIVCANWSAPSIWKTDDDRMCFATTIGLAVFDARDAVVDLSPPPVYIEGAEVDRKPVHWEDGTLTVPPNRGELDIRYTALDLRAPEKCRFKYRLEGVDSDWTDAEAHRTAHYSYVEPGKYTFRVMACDKDGVWNTAGASLQLDLRPHFWQTIWFRILALAALAGMAGGSARFITQRKMQRKLELAEREHAVERERGRIAQDIHDDLGSSLTRIMLLGLRAERELAERREIEVHLKKIVNFSRATIQAMDEIVWAVNPSNDNLDGLVSYLNEYAAQFFQDTRIRCRLQMPVTSQLTLRTEVRHDLFLAFKEALTNVLKHSNASEVHVRVLHNDSIITIIVDDNGCGFAADPGGNGRHGNGLRNMRKRMDAVGGQMEIITTPGHGTRLQFVVRVPTPPLN